MNKDTSIIIRDLYKTYHHQNPILKGINLEITPGELTVIIGRSGCGKSTLLRCLNGLEVLDKGTVAYGDLTLKNENHDERQFEKRARLVRGEVGMVFQSFNLFPHLTVLENLIKAPMVVKKMSRDEAIANAKKLLDKVGLASHAHHYPSQLSGGQQQRAAIARALAMSPKVMLYDEPTSALDPWLVDEVFEVMRTLDAEGMTQIVVTHEMRFVREVASKIIFMENGEVIEMGSTEQMFNNPQNPKTKHYLSRFH